MLNAFNELGIPEEKAGLIQYLSSIDDKRVADALSDALDGAERRSQDRTSSSCGTKRVITAASIAQKKQAWEEKRSQKYLAKMQDLGDGPGTELIRNFQSMKMPTCQACWKLAKQMNEWGPEGCRERMHDIVDDMFPRAKNWYKSSSPWMRAETWFKSQLSLWDKMKLATLSAVDVDMALKQSIQYHVNTAIEIAESRQEPVQ